MNEKNEKNEEIMVIVNLDLYEEDVCYSGNSELEAFQHFKKVKGKYRTVNIVKAKVERGFLKNVPFIMDYEVTEILK